jgi:hypothetical protein
MRLKLGLATLAALSCSVASARLGETIGQCDLRYGTPTSFSRESERHTRFYTKDRVRVIVSFVEGRAAEVYYRAEDVQPLSAADIRLFLQVNAGKSAWVKVDQAAEWKKAHPGARMTDGDEAELVAELTAFARWRRRDTLAEAAYDRLSHTLVVYDAAHMARERARAQLEAANPRGF